MAQPTASDVTKLAYDEYVQCRALLHAWDDIPLDAELLRKVPRKWHNTRSTLILAFRCERCETVRFDIWSRVTGDLVDRAYRTPEGYALPKGKGRKVLVRKEYIVRFHGNGKR